MIKRFKLIWFLLMVLLLFVSVLWYWLLGNSSQEEILIEFSLLTIFLTFPVGYIVYAGAGLIAWSLNYEAGGISICCYAMDDFLNYRLLSVVQIITILSRKD